MQLNKTIASLSMALLFSPVVVAQVNTSKLFDSQVEIVEELLQIDSKLALEKARDKAAKDIPPPPVVAVKQTAPRAMPDSFEVVSIMGMTGEKMATIAINGQTYRNLRVGSSAGGYKVSSIGGGCVDMEPLPGDRPKGNSKKAIKSNTSQPVVKKVCFDFQAEKDAALAESMATSAAGAFGSNGGGAIGNARMTIAPLPLPTIPAVTPAVGVGR